MLYFLVVMFSAAFVIFLLWVLSFLFFISSNQTREGVSGFECGFEFHPTSRITIRGRFFLLCVIFLIFDIELVVLLPKASAVFSLFIQEPLFLVWGFILLLGAAFFLEWGAGELRWSS